MFENTHFIPRQGEAVRKKTRTHVKYWFLVRQISIISRNLFSLEHFLSRR